MGGLSIWHILILALVAVLLFGRGRISDMMGDVARGIRQFRKGLNEPDDETPKAIPPGEAEDQSTTMKKDTASH